jgi:hypothetical protein
MYSKIRKEKMQNSIKGGKQNRQREWQRERKKKASSDGSSTGKVSLKRTVPLKRALAKEEIKYAVLVLTTALPIGCRN